MPKWILYITLALLTAMPTVYGQATYVLPNSTVSPSYKQGFARNASEAMYPNLWDGLVAYYIGLGNTGNTLYDSSGHGNHAPFNSSSTHTWGAGVPGINVDFPGNNTDYATAPESASLTIGAGSFTYACWYRHDNTFASSEVHLLGTEKTTGSSTGVKFYVNSAGRIAGKMYDGSTEYVVGLTAADALTTDEWHLVCLVVSRIDNNIYTYIDGKQIDTTDISGAGSFQKSAYGMGIGWTDNPSFTLDGEIAKLGIWNRALSPNEIKQLYVDPNSVHRMRSRVVAAPAAAEEEESTAMHVVLPLDTVSPSYKQGYARSQSEAMHPQLWKGLIWSGATGLGNSGGTLHDTSSCNKNGDIFGCTWIIGGQLLHSNYLNFTGAVTDYVDVDSTVLDGRNNVTYSYWAQSSDVTGRAPFGSANALNDNEGVIFHATAANYRIYTGGNQSTYAQFVISDPSGTQWHHYVAVRDSTNQQIRFYLDGVEHSSSPIAKALTAMEVDAGGFIIGQEQDNVGGGFTAAQAWNGGIANFNIYNRVLNANEVRLLYEDKHAVHRLAPRYINIAEAETPVVTPTTFQVTTPVVSYKQGYARSQAEAINKNLWKGLVYSGAMLGNTGTTLYDNSLYHNDGTFNGDPTWAVGGTAIEFDGTGDYINAGHGSSLDLVNNFSISLWVKPTTTATDQYILGRRTDVGDSYCLLIAAGDTELQVLDGAAGSVAMGHNFVLNEWAHVVVNFLPNGTSAIAYLNGSAGATKTINAYSSYPTQDLFLASRDGGSFPFTGQIGNVHIYNRTLSPNEIKQLYIDESAVHRPAPRQIFIPPVETEEPEPEETTASTMVLPLDLLTPSYKQGFARSASEALNPNLWDGLVYSGATGLGNTGQTLHDNSLYNTNGAFVNSPTWVVGEKGMALDLERDNDDNVDIGSFSSTIFSADFTMSMWLKAETLNATDLIFDKRSSGSAGFGFRYTGSAGKALVKLNANSIQTSDGVVIIGIWHHIVAIRTGSAVDLYIDGIIQASGTTSADASNTNTAKIGTRSFTSDLNSYDGIVSNVHVWERGLAVSETKQLFVDPHAVHRMRSRVVAFAGAVEEEEDTTVTIVLPLDIITPSYHQGFARNAGSALYPGLRKGIQGLYVTSLGVTGTTTQRDLSGYHRDATMAGISLDRWKATEKGYVIEYDGEGDRTDTNYNFSPPVVTVAQWIKTGDDVTTLQDCWAKYASATDSFGVTIFSGNIYINNDIDDDGETHYSTAVSTNTWYHVVAMINLDLTTSLYINGVLQGSGSDVSAGLDSYTADVFIGTRSSGSIEFAGLIGDTVIYDRALNSAEVRLLYRDSHAIFRMRSKAIPIAASSSTRRIIFISQVFSGFFSNYKYN